VAAGTLLLLLLPDSIFKTAWRFRPSLRAKRSNPALEQQGRKLDCFAYARNDVETQLRDLAACFRARFEIWSGSLRKEGAGNAGRSMRPIAACAMVVIERTRVVRSHRNHPAFPTQWFTAYFVFSPELGLFGLRHLADNSAKLGASVEASGPHDFAVRSKCPRQKHLPRPPHPAPRFVTIASRPLWWDGTRRI
jgi:hypothetical protein